MSSFQDHVQRDWLDYCLTSNHHDTQINNVYFFAIISRQLPQKLLIVHSCVNLQIRSFFHSIVFFFTFQGNRKYQLKACSCTLTYPFFVYRQIHFCPPINICSIKQKDTCINSVHSRLLVYKLSFRRNEN